MRPLTIPRVSIERMLKIAFIALLVMFFAGYAYYQARNLIEGPALTLTGEPGAIQRDRALTLMGTARNVVVLRLNGHEIHTNEQGQFEHTLTLENGYTILTIEALDRYGRKTELRRSFIYEPEAENENEAS